MVAQLLVAMLTTALKSCLRAEWWTALFAHGRSQENVLCARQSLKSHRRNLKTMDSKTRGRGNGAQSRAPRSMTSFKCLYKAIDSTAGGQGNDVLEPIDAGHELPWIQRRAAEATTPRSKHRGSRSHSKSALKRCSSPLIILSSFSSSLAPFHLLVPLVMCGLAIVPLALLFVFSSVLI